MSADDRSPYATGHPERAARDEAMVAALGAAIAAAAERIEQMIRDRTTPRESLRRVTRQRRRALAHAPLRCMVDACALDGRRHYHLVKIEPGSSERVEVVRYGSAADRAAFPLYGRRSPRG